MTEPSSDPRDDRKKRIAKAVGGIVVFLGIGVLLAPGMALREQKSEAPRELAPVRPPGDGAAPASTSASLDLDPGSPIDSAPSQDGEQAFDCMIVPSEVIEVGSPITGLLEEIPVERGDYVEASQVVAQLEANVEKAAVRVARARAQRTDDIETTRANLALSQKRLARAEELFERNVLSLDTRQEAETRAELAALELARAEEDHRLAKLQLAQARASLERRTIRTPVSGVVVERLLAPGEVVDEETILRVARVDPLRVEAILPAGWFGRTHAGDVAEVVPEAPLDAPREAVVAIVDPVLDGASGTFAVQLDLPNPERSLPAGLRCRVRLDGTAPAETALRPHPPSVDPSSWVPAEG